MNVEATGNVNVRIADGAVVCVPSAKITVDGTRVKVEPCPRCGTGGGSMIVCGGSVIFGGASSVFTGSRGGGGTSTVGFPGGRVVIQGKSIAIEVAGDGSDHVITLNGTRVSASTATAEAAHPPACTVCTKVHALPGGATIRGVVINGNATVEVASSMVNRDTFAASVTGNGDVEVSGERVNVANVTARVMGNGDAKLRQVCATSSVTADVMGNGSAKVSKTVHASCNKSKMGNGSCKVKTV